VIQALVGDTLDKPQLSNLQNRSLGSQYITQILNNHYTK
jgi:hypothetical protein